MAAIIDILKDAATDLSIANPIAIGSGDQTTAELVYFANRALREAIKWHDWTALAVEGQIVGDGVTISWPTPAGFDRMSNRQSLQRLGDTAYRLFGPLTADQRTDWRARNMLTINPVFWFRAGRIVVQSPLGTGQQALYEYQTKNAVKPVTGSNKSAFETDQDQPLIDDDLILFGVVWMYRRSKGQDYAQEYENWRAHAQITAARDSSLHPVAAGRKSDYELPEPVVPETIVVA